MVLRIKPTTCKTKEQIILQVQELLQGNSAYIKINGTCVNGQGTKEDKLEQ